MQDVDDVIHHLRMGPWFGTVSWFRIEGRQYSIEKKRSQFVSNPKPFAVLGITQYLTVFAAQQVCAALVPCCASSCFKYVQG